MPPAYRPSGLFRRLAAITYDLLLVIGLWMLATAVLLPFTGGEAIDAGNWLFRLYLAGVAFGFFGVFWTRDGQTLGMKAWRIRVQRPDGGTISWRQALIRFLTAGVSAAPAGAGFLWQYFDEERRNWHDRASGSVLVVLPRGNTESVGKR